MSYSQADVLRHLAYATVAISIALVGHALYIGYPYAAVYPIVFGSIWALVFGYLGTRLEEVGLV